MDFGLCTFSFPQNWRKIYQKWETMVVSVGEWLCVCVCVQTQREKYRNIGIVISRTHCVSIYTFPSVGIPIKNCYAFIERIEQIQHHELFICLSFLSFLPILTQLHSLVFICFAIPIRSFQL